MYLDVYKMCFLAESSFYSCCSVILLNLNAKEMSQNI